MKKLVQPEVLEELSINDTGVTHKGRNWSFTFPKEIKNFHERKLDDIFPFSPAPLKKEEMWAGIINSVLDANAELKVSDLLTDITNSGFISFNPDQELEERIKALLDDLYLIEPRSSKSMNKTPYILPFHLEIIKNVKTSGVRNLDNLFKILLTNEDGEPAEDIYHDLVQLLNDKNSLTPLDQLILLIVESKTKTNNVNSSNLKNRYDNEIEGGYDFYKKQGQLFKRDIRRIMRMNISNIEKIRYFTILIGIHFSLYFIRINYYVDEEVKTFFSAIKGENVNWKSTEEYDEDFHNKIPFTFHNLRTPLSSNPVIMCEEMKQILYVGYINMVLIRTLRKIAKPVLGKDATLQMIWSKMNQDEEFKNWINNGMMLITDKYFQITELTVEDQEMIFKSYNNCPERFFEAVKRYYARKKPSDRIPTTTGFSVIRHYSERGSSYSFIGNKGGVGDFYSIGQDLLVLLVHLIVNKGEKISYKSFLNKISEYGFLPEKNAESELLKQLDEIGLLQKFSDSGDAIYVRTIF